MGISWKAITSNSSLSFNDSRERPAFTQKENMGTAFKKYTATEYIDLQCYMCGCWFAMDSYFYTKRLEDHKDFYCPNGHSQVFTGESLKEKNARLTRELEQQKTKTLWANNEAEKKAKEVTRLKKRAKNGCCPCCKRSFTNLQRHIATKHPDFAK